jgi:dihydroflavonol-4-reductase
MNLVTGANGLVGSHLLVELVKQGKPAIGLLRDLEKSTDIKALFRLYFPNDFEEKFNSLEFRVGDVTDIPSLEDALTGIDTVYHTAALVSFRKKDRDLLHKTNVEGTANVVNCCLYGGIKKIGFVSSTAALGRSLSGEWVTESTKWKNSKKNSFYAISKFCAEREVWRGTEEGLSATIVNPSVIIGPGDYARSSGKLFSTISKGMKFYTEGVNGYVDVRDVCRALVELTEKEKYNSRYILCGENKSYKDVFTEIANELGKNPPGIKAGRFMLKTAVWAEWIKSLLTGKHPTVTKETARNALNSTYYNNSKIKTELGFSFTPINESIKHTAKHFMATLKN